jgi:hypothetical protein
VRKEKKIGLRVLSSRNQMRKNLKRKVHAVVDIVSELDRGGLIVPRQ